MNRIALISLLVRDYDEAIDFYTTKLGFRLTEDTDLGGGKRWVRVAPPGDGRTNSAAGAELLLAKAVTPEQESRIGNQTGGRVFLFIETDDFARDHAAFTARGVRFVRPPRNEPYGRVAVLADLYGNLIDLIGPRQKT